MNPENDKRDDSDSSTPAEVSSSSTSYSYGADTPAESCSSGIDTTPSEDSSSSAVTTHAEDSSSSAVTTPPEANSSSAATTHSEDNSSSVVTTPSEGSPMGVKNTLQLDALNPNRREDRRNWVQNVNLTLDYIGIISRDKKLHFRASDLLTSKLLIASFVLAVGFAMLPYFEMNAIAAFAYVLADGLLFGAITVFVVSRFGIIRAMEPRHALVCWHLMVGTGLLALVIGFNVVAGVVLFMLRDRLPLLFPGG